ncbi:MAG: tryptophan synthase subunit alpha [Gemmatimonadetes bacterium]|nr:tryptophan synthase subunit alpha [Gemmatimonadota bacterium]
MSDRPLAARWRELTRRHRVALIPYLTAGYPTNRASLEALHMVVEAGADFVELGVPFSDPLADGPTIQRASLALLRQARLGVPVIAFSYLNPLLAYGLERFAGDAAAAGVAGVLVTDLPAGEDPEVETTLRAAGLAVIRLVAPTSTVTRLEPLVRGAEGFLYLIARLGVTGPRTVVGDELAATIARVRAATTLPIAVGFGIAGAAQARAVARLADGVVVGSALVERLGQGLEPARELMQELREALSSCP